LKNIEPAIVAGSISCHEHIIASLAVNQAGGNMRKREEHIRK
jgi:hypothetical protein